MYQDKAPSPASSSDSDPKAKLKMKITQMLEQRRGGNKMASPASVSTSAPSKDALPIDESDTDIAKMEDVDHADGDDALSVCSEPISACSSTPTTTSAWTVVSPSALSRMQGLVPVTYKAPQTAVEHKSGLLAILPVIFHCQFDGLQS
jgi:hypothetical protein